MKEGRNECMKERKKEEGTCGGKGKEGEGSREGDEQGRQ